QKTIAGVRVGQIEGKFIINPTFEERKNSQLDLIVAGTSDGIVMVEAGAKEVTEADMVTALETAHAAIKEIVAGIDALAKQAGKTKKTVAAKTIAPAFVQEVRGKAYDKLASAMRIHDK